MIRTGIIILAAILGMGIAAPCPCQEEQQEEQPRKIKVVAGNIADLDWAGSKMVIKGYDPADNSFQDIVIGVPDGATLALGCW